MFGWLKWLSPKLWLYFGGMALLAVAAAFLRKSGADAEKLQQAKADTKAATTIGQKRTEARASSDAELNAKVDKWSRKP